MSVKTNRLMKFGCSCGQRYRLMVRNTGDRFVCRRCAAEFVFPGTQAQEAPTQEAKLRAELDQARARVAELEVECRDQRELKMVSDRQWVNETLSLYLEFETQLRPRVRDAEAQRDEQAAAAASAREEVDRAWELIDSGEKAHEKTLELLRRNVEVLERQRKVLLALHPVLRAVADDPELFRARGVDVDRLMVRGAVFKALELLERVDA